VSVRTPWDPLAAWPAGRPWLWAMLAVFACLVQGPDFLKQIRPPWGQGVDFFQEWASAKNALNGLPVYTDQEISAELYLGFKKEPGDTWFIHWNAHPPTSVLLALPFAYLDYPDATLAWNLASIVAFGASLVIIARGLGIRLPPWGIFPIVALCMVCNPFRQQVIQGQLNAVLLLLITGAWAADRSGRPTLAGSLLGVATAIKLFPGLLIVHFALRRQWRAVAAGIATFVGLTALTVAILGVDAYRGYVRDALPTVGQFRSWWPNNSLVGFWTKAFDTGADYFLRHIDPVVHSPAIKWAGMLLSVGAVLLLWAREAWRARTESESDFAFAIAVTTMLLVSPITWDHYFLLLALPLALVWVHLPETWPARGALLGIAFLLWTSPTDLWRFSGLAAKGPARISAPIQLLTGVSLHCYTLVALLGMLFWVERQAARSGATQSPPADVNLG
jgi:hypothetical protein